MVISGLIILGLSTYLGKIRNVNILYEMLTEPSEFSSWWNPSARIISWVVSTVLSTLGAYLIVSTIANSSSQIILMAIAIFIRWAASYLLAKRKIKRDNPGLLESYDKRFHDPSIMDAYWKEQKRR